MNQCRTREIKVMKAERKRKTSPVSQRAVSTEKLFSGMLHFVSLLFPNGLAVSNADLDTAIRYMQLAAPMITRYCSEYGSNSIGINETIITYSPSTTSYNDATLEQWAESIARQNSISDSDCLVFLNPQGAINSDADATKGVLGYHNITPSGPSYCFVNVMGTGFTIDDGADIYAVALSHEVAEMCVDPLANLSNPEISDECAGNCQVDFRNFFDSNSIWISASLSSAFPPNFPYTFFTEGIVLPADAKECPAPAKSCQYAPPL